MAQTHDNQARSLGLWGELLTAAVYKRHQGRFARQATFAALALTVAVGAWRLYEFLQPATIGAPSDSAMGGLLVPWLIVPAIVLAVGLWLAYRVVNLPRFADFLIAVEAEMAKVSWPSGQEVFRSSAVIIFLMFALAGILAAYDLFWWFALRYVLRIG